MGYIKNCSGTNFFPKLTLKTKTVKRDDGSVLKVPVETVDVALYCERVDASGLVICDGWNEVDERVYDFLTKSQKDEKGNETNPYFSRFQRGEFQKSDVVPYGSNAESRALRERMAELEKENEALKKENESLLKEMKSTKKK